MITRIMIIVKTRWKLIGERTIQHFGNSDGVPLPSDVQEYLGVKLGSKVILVLDREEKELRVIIDSEMVEKLESIKSFHGFKNYSEIIRFLIGKEYQKTQKKIKDIQDEK